MKRIVALFCVVLMATFAVPAFAHAEENTTLTLTADKTVANPGDRVTFSLILGAVNNLGGMSLYIVLPEGLSIDYDSVALPEGVADTLDISEGDTNIPTAINDNILDFAARKKGYTGTEDLCILNFTCMVDSDSTLETKSVGINVSTIFDQSLDMNEIEATVQEAQLKVEGAKDPAATPEPAATPTPEPAATATPEPAAKPAEESEEPRQYLSNLDELIEGVKSGTIIRVSKKDGIFSLNRDILRTLNECGVSLEMEYTYQGKDYKIFIPAGKAVIDDDVFWYGPLYLAGMYGNNSTGLGALSQITQEVGQALKQIIDLNP